MNTTVRVSTFEDCAQFGITIITIFIFILKNLSIQQQENQHQI